MKSIWYFQHIKDFKKKCTPKCLLLFFTRFNRYSWVYFIYIVQYKSYIEHFYYAKENCDIKCFWLFNIYEYRQKYVQLLCQIRCSITNFAAVFRTDTVLWLAISAVASSSNYPWLKFLMKRRPLTSLASNSILLFAVFSSIFWRGWVNIMAPGPRVGKKWLAKNNIDFYF